MGVVLVRATRTVNLWLLLAVVLVVLGAGLCLWGVYLVGGAGWCLIVAGAAVVALALAVLPT